MNQDTKLIQRQPTPLLIVISGLPGAGKDSILQRMKERGYPFHFVVTTTDRSMRPGEVHGVDYFFVSTQEFERMIADKELLEYAIVYGQYKGIGKAQVKQALASNQDVVLRIDVQGAKTIRQIEPEAILIFVASESKEALAARLSGRKTETKEGLRTRLEVTAQELQTLPDFDYLVINHTGRLDETVDKIVAIITAEKCRVHRRRISL
jgi:guanylate kinase